MSDILGDPYIEELSGSKFVKGLLNSGPSVPASDHFLPQIKICYSSRTTPHFQGVLSRLGFVVNGHMHAIYWITRSVTVMNKVGHE